MGLHASGAKPLTDDPILKASHYIERNPRRCKHFLGVTLPRGLGFANASHWGWLALYEGQPMHNVYHHGRVIYPRECVAFIYVYVAIMITSHYI